MNAENCPADCTHETFHFCTEAGTHCDKHCVCGCAICADGRAHLGRALSEAILAEKRIFARFVPEAWIHDYAVEIDGTYAFDVTEQVLAMGQEKALALEDNSDHSDLLWAEYSKDFKPGDEGYHHGPFRVECREAIHEYFGVACDTGS